VARLFAGCSYDPILLSEAKCRCLLPLQSDFKTTGANFRAHGDAASCY